MTWTLLVFTWLGAATVPNFPDSDSCEAAAALAEIKLKGGGRVETVCVPVPINKETAQ